jgi:sialate O-acetylesterase
MKRGQALILSLLFLSTSAVCRVKLPKLIGDGMVLQRDANVRVWGWASEGETITVHFMDTTCHATADKNGEWEVTLSGLEAGGPYEMQIDASNSITIHNVAIGDVWVCSGQSNMGMALGWLAPLYQDEIDRSENPFIRQFLAPSGFNFNGRENDFKYGRWQSAGPAAMRDFTAVGYFFAKTLYDAYKVPIGLINASLGGSSAEAWISEESIQSFPKYFEDLQRFKNPGFLEKLNKQDDDRVRNWNKWLSANDEGYKNPPLTWSDPAFDASGWETMHVPGYWADAKPGPVNGVVWFRREINIPSAMAGKPALLKLGRIADADSVFLNGRFIGTTGSQYAARMYKIPEGLLKEGANSIVVRVVSYIRHGGFVPGKQYELSAGNDRIDLAGEWKYRLGSAAEPLEDRLFTGKIPAGLFNGMIAPLLKFKIKGAVWYQGESNTSRAFEHYDLFKLLIHDWRKNWRQGDFPFLYVQLPNFVEVNVETTKYDWALFRESQLKALSIPNTGMAVSVDIGEWNDIHPVNKKDLGCRLALAAQKIAYGKKQIVHSGPIYRSMRVEGNAIRLSFTDTGSGLIAKNGEKPKCFEICGADGEFVPAEARIDENSILVWSDRVASPVAARYAWANNPEGANLTNQEGLPATPFRTSSLY